MVEKKIIRFLITVLILTSIGCSDHKTKYYPNKRIKEECIELENNITLCKAYYENGKLQKIDTIYNDDRIRKSKFYNEKGNLKNEIIFNNDRMVNSKNYDLNKVLINEYTSETNRNFYEYYTNKKLYCISYMTKIEGDSIKKYDEDSTIFFSNISGKKILKTYWIKDLQKCNVIQYDSNGAIINEYKIDDDSKKYAIAHKILGNDTTHLQYMPVLK